MADDATDTTVTETTTAATPPADAAPDAAADEGTVLGGGAEAAGAGETGEGDQVNAGGDGEGATSAVPEKYELTAPEGMSFDTEAFAAAEPVFREIGLSQESAQKLMPVAGELAKRAGAAAVAQHEIDKAQAFSAMKADWLKEAKADTEIGGAKWGETTGRAGKALDMLGFTKGTPFRALLDDTGFGNHPEMIRAFARIGAKVSEDSFEAAGAPASRPKTDAELFYPGMTTKER